jgi:hypothetical protein
MTDKYFEYRDKIQTGDLLQFAATDIVSRIIRFKTKSDISHSAMAFWMKSPVGTQRLFILEGVAFGAYPVFLSNRYAWYLPHGDIYWHKMKPQYQQIGIVAADRMLEKTGTYYDYLDLIKQAFKRVTLNPSKLYCSEYVLYGWSKLIGWPADKAVPYPAQMSTDYFGVYEEEGEKIT